MSMAIANPQLTRSAFIVVEIRRLLRGCVVAIVVFTSYMAAGLGLRHLAGLEEVTAAMLAVIIASPISYFGHALFTFRVGFADRSYALKFVGLIAITFVINWAIVKIGVQRIGIPYWLGLFTTTIIVPIVNYLLLRLYVFASGLRRYAGEH
jgi:putative flippase GtrA